MRTAGSLPPKYYEHSPTTYVAVGLSTRSGRASLKGHPLVNDFSGRGSARGSNHPYDTR